MSAFKKSIEAYAQYVVEEAKKNLLAEGKGDGSLYKSLSYIIKQNRDSGKYDTGYTIQFEMEDYGLFVDKGVKGKDPSKVSPNAKIKGQQAPNSQYKFGSGTSKGTFKSFASKMSRWAKERNIRFRDEKGRFKKGNYESLGYVIAKNIYNRGIRPTMFFTKPFEAGLDKFNEDIAVSYIKDIDSVFSRFEKLQ